MNIFKLQIPLDSIVKVIEQLQLQPEVFWIRFGREVLVFTDKLPKGNFGREPSLLYSFRDEVLLNELHIVVQKGRLFQQHNPRIRVIYDCGRFLLVRMHSDLVGKLKRKNETCYGFIPLKKGQTVFEEHDLTPLRRQQVPFVQSLVDELKRAEFERILRLLTSFPTRFSISSQYMEASSQMEILLRNMGYQTCLYPIQIDGKNSRNIIADKLGGGSISRDIVLVTAHLDSIGEADEEHLPAPGADDNGSGSAGLMEIARVFQTHQGHHDLRLILFGGEEQGCIGSLKYVESLSAAERDRIKAVVNMDMIGFLHSSSQKILIEGGPFSLRVIKGLLEAAATYTRFSSVQTTLEYSDNSDHESFIRDHMPAVLTIEGVEGTNCNIHSANDTIETINCDFALEILRMNVAYIASEVGNEDSLDARKALIR